MTLPAPMIKFSVLGNHMSELLIVYFMLELDIDANRVTVGDQCLINYASKIAECMIYIATSLSRTVPLLLGLVRTGKMVNPSLKDSGSHLLNNSNDDIEVRWFSTELKSFDYFAKAAIFHMIFIFVSSSKKLTFTVVCCEDDRSSCLLHSGLT
jgi:hypothetical protein